MSILTKSDEAYSLLDLGFNKVLIKQNLAEELFGELTPELKNIFSEGIAPKNILSGELAAALDQVQQSLKSGKTQFSITEAGYILGIDATDGLAKFYLGNSTNYMFFDGATLQITGGTVIGTVGGFVTTATSLVGGDLTLSSANQRITWGTGNNILIADADDGTYRLWAGDATAASAPFSVTKTGIVKLDTADINGSTIDGCVIGGSSAAAGTFTTISGTAITGTSFVIGANTLTTSEWANLDGQNQTVASTSSPTFVNLSITSFAANWTNAGRTVADMGILTTVDINGGTMDAVIIGGASAAAGTFTSVTDSGLTSGRVVFATTNGLLTDDADMTFATDTLTATKFAGAFNGTIGATSPAAGIFTSLQADTITNDTGLAAGVYTPTRSSETNLDANVTMTEAQYLRVGNTVTVSGRFTANPTTTLVQTDFEITLPVASNIGAAEDVAGTAVSGTISGGSECAEIIGVVANDTAQIQWIPVDVASQTWSYTFTYQVI